MNKVLYKRGLGETLLTAWLLAAPLYAGNFLHCDHERYFEGDIIQCQIDTQSPGPVSHAEEAKVDWIVLGKDLKTERRLLMGSKGKESFFFTAPHPLRSVTPLQINVALNGSVQETVRLQLFPRDPKYWVGENEFKGKVVLIEKEAAWIIPELSALGIPYLTDNGSDLLALKHVDLKLDETTLKGFDRKDPWFRWSLVQLIRRALSGENEAKN